MWYDNYYDDDSDYWVAKDDDDDKFFEWCDGSKKRKTQEAKIKEVLVPIAWHPWHWWDWCLSEDEKKMIMKHFA